MIRSQNGAAFKEERTACDQVPETLFVGRRGKHLLPPIIMTATIRP
jgi:hypothetical protein